MSSGEKRPVLGLIVGNRGFFPDHLAASGREDMIRVLESANAEVVALTPADSKFGAVETREEAKKCAQLFRSRRDDIDGGNSGLRPWMVSIGAFPFFNMTRPHSQSLFVLGPWLDLP